MKKTTRETERFVAVDDAGREYTLVVETEFFLIETFNGSSETEGNKAVRTSDGRTVQCESDEVFRVFPAGPVLRRKPQSSQQP